MKFTLTSFLFLYTILCLNQNALAQTFPTKRYTTREGLAQMQVLSLLEDSRGILWIGTRGGLSKYDGLNFKNYRRADGDSLINDLIVGLKEDSKGNIWICTAAGINKFDGAKFHSWKFSNPNEHSNAMYISKKDEVFVLSDLSVLYQIIEGKLTKLINLPSYKLLTQTLPYFDLATDEMVFGYIDAKPNATTYLYKREKNKLKYVGKSNFNEIECYQYGDKGIVYTYRKNNELKRQYYFLGKGEKVQKMILTVDGNSVNVHQTLPFNFAFSFQDKLTILEKNTANYQQLTDNFLNSRLLQIDKNGIWVGTQTGLWRVMDNGLKYLPESRDAVVWGMVEDKFNRLWTLHYNTSVPIKIHEGIKTTNLTNYQASLSKQLGKTFDNQYYFRPLKDQYQNLWLPSANGLIRYDYKEFKFVFKNIYSFFLTEDRKRNLIVSSVDKGVNLIENKPPYKVTELREKDGLHPNQQMLCVFVDSKGKHWYGGGGGLTTYEYEQKKFFRYKMKSDNVPFSTVIFINEDPYHTLWFGTTRGLFRYQPSTDSFIHVAENTINGFIKSIEILDKNHLFCSNDENVFVLNLTDYYKHNTLNIKTFNYNNGLMGLEPGQAATYKAHDGKVWLTSSDVLSIFDPKDLDLSLKASKAIFTKIDKQSVAFTQATEDSIYQLPKGKIDGVRIEFSSTGFDNALHPNYSYQLDNGGWSEWQKESFVILYSLTQGEHTLKVKTQLMGEQKGIVPLEATLRFRTDIQFWQSPNFVWYLLGFAILMSGFAIAKWIYERLLRKKLETQQKELEFLKVVANQAQMNPHFIFNILQVLQSYIVTEKWHEAKSMVIKLGDLIRNYLEATRIDLNNNKQSIFSTEIELSKEIELLTQFVDFEQIKGSHKFSAKFDIDKNIDIANLTIPPMIIQPIIENAIKHGLLNLDDGERGELLINLSFCNNVLCFIVSDTGVGKEKAAQIKAKALRRHISRGQELILKRIDLLNEAGYKITIQSEENQPHGTKVTICFDYN